MIRCYGHNRSIVDCPTQARCLYCKLLSLIAWMLIRHAGRVQEQASRAAHV